MISVDHASNHAAAYGTQTGKKSAFASFLSAALRFFADPCCAATFSDGLLRTDSFWKP